MTRVRCGGQVGTYTLTYSAWDKAGNEGAARRLVEVVSPCAAPSELCLLTGFCSLCDINGTCTCMVAYTPPEDEAPEVVLEEYVPPVDVTPPVITLLGAQPPLETTAKPHECELAPFAAS